VFERFTERSRLVVVRAHNEARDLRHNYIGTEHLLLGLLAVEEGLAARVLESLGVTSDHMQARVLELVGLGDEVTSGQIPFTPRAKNVLELALREALSLGHNYIGTEHILLGLVRENQGVAARILLECDADAEKVRNQIMNMLSGPGRRAAELWPAIPRVRRTRAVEYRVERWADEAEAMREVQLAELGTNGWELAAVVPSDDDAEWIFQRPVPLVAPGLPPAWTTALIGESGYRPATVADIENAAIKTRQEAQEAGDQDRAALIVTFEQRFDHALERATEALKGRLEVTGTTTLDALVDALRAAKEDAIDRQEMQYAATLRDVERKLVAGLRAIPEALRGSDPT
jgi:hypothetical protein